jgi:hypothetical protein
MVQPEKQDNQMTWMEMQMIALAPEHDIGTEPLVVRCPHCSRRLATRVTSEYFKLTQYEPKYRELFTH